MKRKFNLFPLLLVTAISLSGCAVVSVAGTAVGIAGTAVSAGVSVGSAVVGGTVGAVKAMTPD